MGQNYTNPDGTPIVPDGSALAQSGPIDVGSRGLGAARSRNFADAAANRSAYNINYAGANADLRNASADRNLSLEARGQQTDALGLSRNAAYGNAPSRAELLQRNTLDQGFQQQLAGAASAPGGLAQAAATRRAMQNQAAYNQQGANAIGAMRADEMERARNAYASQAGALRGADFQGQSNDLAMAAERARMAQAQGQMEMAQRGLNQQGQLGFEGLANEADRAQAQTDLGTAGLNAQNWQSWYGQQQEDFRHQKDINQHSTDRSTNAIAGLVGGLGGAGASVLGSIFGKAKGGPVHAGQPYVVGEQGPELVVPSQDATVIPNEASQALVASKAPPSTIGQVADAFGGGFKGFRQTMDATKMPTIRKGRPEYVVALAGGGPMIEGNPYLVGEQGPEIAIPKGPGLGGMIGSMHSAPMNYGIGGNNIDMGGGGSISGAQVRAASTGLAGGVPIRGMVGGGGITGGAVPLNNPGGFGGFREEGGAAERGLAYVVGERGPELVVPAAMPAAEPNFAALAAAEMAAREKQDSVAPTIARLAIAPNISLLRAARDRLSRTTPEQRIAVMDQGAKIGLGPIAGRALIQVSDEYARGRR